MYVAAVIIAAGFVLFYCSYQIRLGAYVRTLCRNRAAGLTSQPVSGSADPMRTGAQPSSVKLT